MFLKRAAFGHIQSEDLFLGAILNVYSRQVKIVEYGDVFTRNELEGKKSRTLALVKPDAYPHLGKGVPTNDRYNPEEVWEGAACESTACGIKQVA